MSLNELRKINWDELDTSNSRSAKDVPDYIEMLTSDEAETREQGYKKLQGALINEYYYGTASPVAVPFLIKLLEDENTDDKFYTLWLLHNMLMYSEPILDDIPPKFKRNRQQFLMIVTGQEIIKSLDVYLALLKHPDWKIRSAAGQIIFWWYRFPKNEETRIKEAFRAFKAAETMK